MAALFRQGQSFLSILSFDIYIYFFFSFRGATPLTSVPFCGVFDVQQRDAKQKVKPPLWYFAFALSLSARSPLLTSQSILPCELIMLCGWRTGAVLLADISRDCLMWQIHTTLDSSLLCFAAIAAPQLCSLTMRTGLFAPGPHQLNHQLESMRCYTH